MRIGRASIFLYHGLGKFMHLQGTVEMMGGMPMPMALAARWRRAEVSCCWQVSSARTS
ncbi:MAG: hypothetical protein CME13_10965 [Gemmatimonadetes bacterium]|nr:hypothetical protein [Gemmatimonadota bacterium]